MAKKKTFAELMAEAALQGMPEDKTTADLLNVPLSRGAILPLTEYLDRAEFDLSSGLPGAFADAVTAPARAARGEISEDQQIPEAFNFAGSLTLGSLLAPRPTGSVGMGGGPTKKQFREYLNKKFPFNPSENNRRGSSGNYGQRGADYGDYLWRNDRGQFDFEYAEWLKKQGNDGGSELSANAKTGAAVPLATKTLEAQQPQGIRAFHGSPHNYKAERLIEWPDGRTEYIEGMPDVLPDVPQGARVIKDFPLGRQRLDKIGTGEGAQAYGHGLYEAGAEGTALTYKNAGLPSYVDQRVARHVRDALKEAGGNEKAALDLLNTKALGARDSALRRELFDAVNNFDEARNSGHMYEVNIKADPQDFLDWDKPISQQSEKVREAALSAMERASGGITRNDLKEGATGADAVRYGGLDDPNAMTKALREAGIPGIRYFDQMSRGEGKGSRNYVVFDDAIIDIVKKYGIAGLALLQAAGYGTNEGEETQ